LRATSVLLQGIDDDFAIKPAGRLVHDVELWQMDRPVQTVCAGDELTGGDAPLVAREVDVGSESE
jgi:hypothetical protein